MTESKEMRAQTEFVEALFVNFILAMKDHNKNEKEAEAQKYWQNENYMNKNCGKHALKRKITMLRQELLNLEKML